MGLHEQEERSLAELDAADQLEVERVEAVILAVVQEHRPATISELSVEVRQRAGDVDNATIRAAILRLLNRDQLHVENGNQVAVA
jgi:predicted transcriptional regulator